MRKIAIYGGSFDPIHKGHLHMAQAAIRQFELDELIMMPSYYSPNKADVRLCDANDRIQMCRIATESIPQIRVSDFETGQHEVSYTYRTMQAFRNCYPDDKRYFIMGGDSLDYFDKWRHPEIIAECAHILVLEREQFDVAHLNAKIDAIKALFPAEISVIKDSAYTASSSDIKKQLEDNPKQCPKTLPEAVYQYICSNHLYGL